MRSFVKKRTGIAGYSGSGKSTVARILAGLAGTGGTPPVVIDADAEAKKIIGDDGSIINRLKEVFGPAIMENNRLSFQRLGAVVFSSGEQLAKYNTIVHPPVLSGLRTMLEQVQGSAVILDAALIPLWGIETWFDECVWVHASNAIRLDRVSRKRGDLDRSAIERRLRIQEEVLKEPRDKHWLRIENEGRIEELESAVLSLI